MEDDEILNIIRYYCENNKKQALIEYLKKEDIKRSIIRDFNYEDFDTILFMDERYNGIILKYLFDIKGRMILELLYSADERIEIIFEHPKIASKLMKEEWFCNILSIKNIMNEKINFYEHGFFFDYLMKNKDRLHRALTNKNLPNEGKDYLLRNIDIIKHLSVLPSLDKEVLQPLFNRVNFDLCDFKLEDLIKIAEKEVVIPYHLLNDRKFIERVCTCKDILQIRYLFNMLSKSQDISFLEKERKQNYLNELNNGNDMLIDPFDKIYDEINNRKEKLNSNDIFIIVSKTFTECSADLIEHYTHNIFLGYKDKNLLESLVQLSNEYSSNVILDYLFEEYYYNVFIDLNELISFNEKNKMLSEEKYAIYTKLMQIDKMDLKSKKSLFNYLINNYNMMDEFYDDMLFAREEMNRLVANSLITREKLKTKKNKILSALYGVDVYTYDGKNFFGVIKSGEKMVEHDEPHGYSYSIIGKNAVGTFMNPKEIPTFLYEGLKGEQIVHIFPYDSYTRYDRDKGSTDYVRVLMTPDELLDSSGVYNEMLVIEKGNKPSELDVHFPLLQKIALYCYDKIGRKEVKIAKENGVGIVLVDTNQFKLKDTHSVRGVFNEDYTYYLGFNKSDYILERLEKQREEISNKSL